MGEGFAFVGGDSDDSDDSPVGNSVASDSAVESLLYDGETVAERVPIDDGSLVLTSHRLLAFTPDSDGRTLEVVHRPNVEAVTVASSARSGYLPPALKALLVGALLVGVGATIPVDGVADAAPTAGGASAPGLGQTIGVLGALLSAVALIDDVLRLLGALVLLGGVALLGLYLRSRKRVVVVSVAGGDDSRFRAANVTADDVARLAPEP